ncbi:hypothetical protein [Okeania sp.]|uniref:hypothetical protein n=1 Tax=Okeania sp. TaxID=3100323 RepID=UPI002B4B6B99|nr:hypothetical protein [Okeania sp.]MEB3341045.1 hypothetical protein [Okeania sp.]
MLYQKNWVLVKKKLSDLPLKIQCLNLTIPENNIALANSQTKKLGGEIKLGLGGIFQKVYKFNHCTNNFASLGENQINNLQKITEVVKTLHHKSLTQVQVTKQIHESFQNLLGLVAQISKSVKNFRL